MSTGRPRSSDRSQLRSERAITMLRPAVYDGLRALAQVKNVTVSDLLSMLAEALVRNNESTIAKYVAAQREAAGSVDMTVNVSLDAPDEADQ